MRSMRSNKIATVFLLAFFTIGLGRETPGLIEYNTSTIDSCTKEITITFTVPKKDFIYQDFISCSIDEPTIILSTWKSNKKPISHYDSSFKEAKQIFNETFTITMTATIGDSIPLGPVHIYCSYYRRSEKKINHTIFPLDLNLVKASQHQVFDIKTETLKTIAPIKKHIRKTTYFDDHLLSALCMAHCIITSLCTDHKKYFALLIFIIAILCSFSYFFKKELEKQTKIKEFIEIIISLLTIAGVSYMLWYLHAISSSFVTMSIASLSAAYTGLFYTKKSTKLQSGKLRTFCTFMGIFFICSALLLSFKTLQYADEQFHLL